MVVGTKTCGCGASGFPLDAALGRTNASSLFPGFFRACFHGSIPSENQTSQSQTRAGFSIKGVDKPPTCKPTRSVARGYFFSDWGMLSPIVGGGPSDTASYTFFFLKMKYEMIHSFLKIHIFSYAWKEGRRPPGGRSGTGSQHRTASPGPFSPVLLLSSRGVVT